MTTFSVSPEASLFVGKRKPPYSWDQESENEYLLWVSKASLAEKKACIALMTVFIDGIVTGKGEGIPSRDMRSVYSADIMEVDLYRATRKADMCMFAGRHRKTDQCRLVLLGPCSKSHQWQIATDRIKNWRVY